jgi:Na+/proline symporter/signal transduction histidine kinase
MIFSVDSFIFIGFLIANVVFGLTSSHGVKSIREYAVGNRNFSTATLVATIVATWVSGEFFYSNIFETYSKGLYAMWIALGDPIYLLTIGLFFAPRMREFLGKLSIADAMGGLYGDRARVITAVASVVGTAGLIGVQLKLAGLIFEYALGIPGVYGIIVATLIVTMYSALGGIRSVTFTDVIQFFTFGVIIPIIAYVLLTSIDNLDVVKNTLNTSPLFDYKQVFDFSNPLAFKQLLLFLLFVIPGFNPSMFQRIAMARNTKQVAKSFIIAAITCLFFEIIINWISILTLSISPDLEADDVVKQVILNSSYIGLKGAILAGIMAMIMSTVDSCINSTAVIIVHDFCKPLKIKLIKSELFSARIASWIIGALSLLLSLHEGSLLELLVITELVYMPIVSAPFVMAIFGFRSTEKPVILGMLAGLITVVVGKFVLDIPDVNNIFIGTLANLMVLFGSHYFLRQEGGWVGIKDYTELVTIRRMRKIKFQRFLSSLKNCSIVRLFKDNHPKGEGLMALLGVFVMISSFSSAHTLDKEYQVQYKQLLSIFYPITLCSATILMTYPLWLESWKNTKLVAIFWNVIMFFILICFGFLMALISEFSEIQLMAFMVNIMVISSLAKWQWSFINIVIGVGITSFYYANYIIVEGDNSFSLSQFKIVYLLLLVSSSIVLFLKPKQYLQELSETQNEYLKNKLKSQEEELNSSLNIKQEFLRNLEHESRTPIVGISSLGQVLYENYYKLTEDQRYDAIRNISKSSERLSSLIDNILNLSKLNSLDNSLKFTSVNLSELIYKRVNHCKKLYIEEASDLQEFILKIEDNIITNCDKYYITTAIDNIVINAIQYCKEGTITIRLCKKQANKIEFSVQDEGIGIPEDELIAVFNPSVVSSITKTSAGGRGFGLALCKKVIEVHKGEIWSRCDKTKGVTFSFTIPLLSE